MNVEIIRADGDLKREVWNFGIGLDFYPPCIYLARYSFQTKETKRHKWKAETHWERFDKRNNNIPYPNLPLDVDKEIHERYCEYINSLPVQPQ